MLFICVVSFFPPSDDAGRDPKRELVNPLPGGDLGEDVARVAGRVDICDPAPPPGDNAPSPGEIALVASGGRKRVTLIFFSSSMASRMLIRMSLSAQAAPALAASSVADSGLWGEAGVGTSPRFSEKGLSEATRSASRICPAPSGFCV
eukprot:CAMPEP_0167813296 /NCGR_PEP_ID=MMETSP0112_2-20121227/1767_1 /TAXON_ID=91324 /ORGANISM="Lotharella globosa, Strain CCCM811" /LENGTH=147 /DNA_ID=CAMNT_0007712347 /DNA_START=834 /DNA_END=1277 /DNA_ORIENTATION=-